MGITGENFRDEVRQQVEERQKFFAKTNKTDKDIITQNPNAWLRLASSVDLSAISSQFPNSTQYLAALARVTELTNRLQVIPGSDLAKLNVLTGGTAYYDPTAGTLSPGKGIAITSGIYQTAYGNAGLDYGFRPMPSIQSANITYYNNGALAKADINIIVNSPQQLDALELLYLRPGYTILLEWGHNNFVDNSGVEQTVDTTGYITEPFTEFFDSSGFVDREELQEALAREREKKSFNYDGFYGVITNFSWTLNKDASYKVTLKAITTGAVIESLKIASNSNITPPPTPVTGSTATTPVDDLTLSQQLEGRKSESDIFYALGRVAKNFEVWTSTPFLFDASVISTIDDLNLGPLQYDGFNGNILPNGPPPQFFVPPRGSQLAWRIESSDTNQSSTNKAVYITFDALLAHIQANCVLYTGTGRPYIRTEIGLKDSIPMLSIPGRFSGDPTVCIINFNRLVDTRTSTPNNIKFSPIGFNLIRKPFTYNLQMNHGSNHVRFNQRRMADSISAIGTLGVGSPIVLAPTASNPSLPATSTEYIGYLNSVHVNIEYIAKTLDDCVDEAGEVKLIDFLQKIVDGISEALGSINDFKVKYDDRTHTVRIYDQALKGKTPSITKFRSYGVVPGSESTIIKDLSITTQLSNEMASMIAIGAQANANIISENATAFSEFNLGLVDRITQVKVDTSGGITKTPFEKFTEVTDNILKYIEAIYPISGEGFNLNSSNITTLKKLNKDYCRYLVGHFSTTEVEFETPFIIPFKASVTIPGLSGATIYQKFGMDNLLLPYSYKDKVEYLIINLEHKIENNVWDTTYQTYTIPVPVTSSGKTYSSGATTPAASTAPASSPASTTPVTYIPNPVPSLRSATIFTDAAGTSIPYYIGGRPNQGTHSYTNSNSWYNWNAYDLHQAANTYVFAPTRMQLDKAVNYGSTVTSTGGLNLVGIGAVFIDLATGKRLYFAHLGALNDKLKPGSQILEKGEFVGTLASTAPAFYPHLHFAIEGTFDPVTNTYTPDLFDTYLEKTARDTVPPGTTPPDRSVASFTKGKGTFR